MLFSSTLFIYFFLPAVLIIYYGFLRKNRNLQNIFLTIASLIFYAWGEPKFVLVMLFSIVANWFLGILVASYHEKGMFTQKKLSVLAAVVINLAILFIFKYLTFSLTVIDQIFHSNMRIPQITLPIGISFFTFQAMSYVIDVSRGRGTAQKSIINVGLYISFFPQLIAGPIVRYETVAQEILHRKENADEFFDGFARFIIGLAKKVLLANSLSVFADNAFFNMGEVSVAGSWLGVICYALQLLFDFGGYSDMAIGMGKMFGFHFLENFNYPYISRSISEFWRRWHISLGTWFRDYVYFPLGGSRVSKPRLFFNLFCVWFLTGFWHGANWTYVAWGLINFVLLIFEKYSGLANVKTSKPVDVLRWMYTMFFVMMGYVIFKCETLAIGFSYIKVMLGLSGNALINATFFEQLRESGICLIFGIIFSIPITNWFRTKFNTNHAVTKILYNICLICLFILSVSSIISSSHNPFIYFNF